MSFTRQPAGYHTITPAIIVRGAADAIAFYKAAFGAEEVSRMASPDGKIAHAEIRIGDSIVMLGDENPDWGVRSPQSINGSAGSLHIYVDDVDAVFHRAVAAGAHVKYPLEDAFWGDRYAKLTDPFGHEWGIATRVRNLTPEEMQRASNEWFAKAAQAPAEANA